MSPKTNTRPLWVRSSRLRDDCDSMTVLGSCLAGSLDLLSRNLVGVNGMMCEGCGSKLELTHINENYVAYGMCEKCKSSEVGD